MGLKYLAKRYQIDDVSIFLWLLALLFSSQMKTWKEALKEADSNNDGKLSFLEFQNAVKLAEQKMREKNGAWIMWLFCLYWSEI